MKKINSKDCGEPPSYPNTTVEITMNESNDIYTVNTLLTFACATGYQILPAEDNELVCSETGSWEGEVGKCYTGLYFDNRMHVK